MIPTPEENPGARRPEPRSSTSRRRTSITGIAAISAAAAALLFSAHKRGAGVALRTDIASSPSRLPVLTIAPPDGGHDFMPPMAPEATAMWRWAKDYVRANPAEREAMLETGKTVATAHRQHMKSLIARNPRRALEEALPMVWRQDLPDSIVQLLEERVNARGSYQVLGSLSATGGTSESGAKATIRRTFTSGAGKRYQAMVYGSRVRQHTTENASLHGVAIDGLLAVHEDPLRPLETGERIRPGEPVISSCPVSGEKTAEVADIAPETPAVETGGEFILLCSGGHIHALREQRLAREGGTGGPTKPTGAIPSSSSTGVKTILYMRVAFPGQNTDPQPEKDAYDVMKTVNDFFVENSHGAVQLLTTVTPLLIMPKPESWYAANDDDSAIGVLIDARALARAHGYDFSSYDLEAVRYNGASGNFSGQAAVGGRGVWLKSGSAGVACHEFGHNLGMWHANFWDTGAESVIGSGHNAEYGNVFDTMGSANAGNYWFNAGHQHLLDWIPENNVTRVISSGLYRLDQFDQGGLDPAGRYLLSISRDPARDYWCEFRQKWTTNNWMMNGMPLLWAPWGDEHDDASDYGSNGGSQLLDTTPGSLDGRNDSALVIGRTFSDFGAGLHFTPVAKTNTTPPALEVVVNKGSFPGNQSPGLTLSAGAMAAEVDQTITFTATAVDPDGDPLAFSWDWGDRTFGTNSAIAEKSWSAAGIYTVRCEVSDLRGGTRSALMAVTIGNPALAGIGGRVLTAGGDPLANVRVSSLTVGASSTNPRVCLTDSDGNFLLSGLPEASYTVSASHPLYTMAASFTNPVVLTAADEGGINFTANPRTSVSMTLSGDSCTEGGDGAMLRFTRNAATNSGAIGVRVLIGGSATTADVSFLPTPVLDQETWLFTIPSGQPFLEVAVSAMDDTAQEGPEVITFHLVDGTGYIPDGVETVALAVNDDDTSLPVVSVVAVDDTATEGTDTATLRISRTGPVEAPLVVNLSRTGNASAAQDYSGIPAAVTIPAEASFVDLTLTALADGLVEGTETVTFSVSSSAAWIRAPLNFSATAVILDSDIPTVSVAATDSQAAEAGNDPAVFIFTRTGSTSAPLTVDYALGGTAQHGTDYLPLPGTVTIPAGQPSAALVIRPVDDAIGEPLQTVSVQVRAATRYATGAAFNASATIADNDLPRMAVTVFDGLCSEANNPGRFRIQSHGSGAGSIPVHYTVSGTATAGVDYTALSGTINVARGGSADVTVTTLQDILPENAESVILTIVPDPAYTITPEDEATLWITDDDQALVSVTAAAVSYAETAGPARFFLSRNGATTDALSVNYALTGTATASADYVPPAVPLVIPAGADGAFLDVTLRDDALSEGAESLICTVLPLAGSYGTSLAQATVYLNDNEIGNLPLVNFATSASSAPESAGRVNITVNLSASSPTATIRVDYALDAGSAFNDADFRAGGGSLFFPPGIISLTIPVDVVDDSFIEPVETLTLRLLRASSARIGAGALHTLSITDNDVLPPPVLGFSGPASTAEEGAATLQNGFVFLYPAQTGPITVAWTVTGGTVGPDELSAAGGTVTFLAGETAKPIPLGILDDPFVEAPETIVLTLSSPGAPATLAPGSVTHTVTVQDNDDTVITLTATPLPIGEDGTAPGQLTVTRTASSLTASITVDLDVLGTATPGEDFIDLPRSITIPGGVASVTLPVAAVEDEILDPGETILVSAAPSPLYSPGTPSVAGFEIADNETGVSVTATDPIAGEPSDTGTFTFTRTGPLDGELIVSLITGGTASPESDFVPLPETMTFADGQSTAVMLLTPVNDEAVEPQETVSLSIPPAAGYLVSPSAASAEITITDDDANQAPVVSILSPAENSSLIPPGPGLILKAAVTDDGRPIPPQPLVTQWSKLSGPGTVTFSDASSVDTTAIFDAPGNYTLLLTASDGDLTAESSLSILVLADTLTGVNVNTTSTLTTLTGSGSEWTVTGVGTGFGATATDSFYFAHRAMRGDFTIVTRLASTTPAPANGNARSGVMIRSSSAPNATYALMSATPIRSSFAWRPVDNASSLFSNTTQTSGIPRFLRLRRTGNVFTASHSLDGTTWVNQGAAQTIPMPDPVLAGLAVCSANGSATLAASFDSFSVTPSGNTGPFVDAGPALTSGLNCPLAGVVADDSPDPSVRWEKLTGPGNVLLPETATGTATFDAPGIYTLRLIADDGGIQTFDDTEVTIGGGQFADWQSLHFGEAAADPSIAGPTADPDQDGLENLAEYVLLSDPMLPGSAAMPGSTLTNNTLKMIWRESTTAPDASVSPQWSDDLALWNSTALTVEVLASGEGWVEKCASLDTTDHPRAGLRLLISLP